MGEVMAMVPTRGERNNNPGNIEWHAGLQSFLGELGPELVPAGETPRFARFATAEAGIRAIGRILRSYREHDDIKTIGFAVARWAPAGENNAAAYLAAVCEQTGLAADHPLTDDAGDNAELVRAIIHQENGRCIYTDQTIADAVGEALT